MKESNRTQKLTIALFALYILAIVWIIVFKLQFSVNLLPQIRDINLIPYYEENIKDAKVYIQDKVYNMLVFVPYGIYISILRRNRPFVQKIAPIFLTSFAFELIQYIFGIGATDITDLIQNTLGGIIGIGVFYVLQKVFKDKSYIIVNTLAVVATVLMLALIGLLLSRTIIYTVSPR